MTFDNLDSFLASIERRAYRMAWLATGNRDESLDIVQDAMLTLVEKYAKHPAAEWPPLFYRVMQNRIRDWHRRHKVRNRWWPTWFGSDEDDDDPVSQYADPAPVDPSLRTQLDNATGKLEQALQALPLRQQQVFLLRVWEGMNVAETARAMNCSQGSVKSHYSRAVHNLREQLDGEWP